MNSVLRDDIPNYIVLSLPIWEHGDARLEVWLEFHPELNQWSWSEFTRILPRNFWLSHGPEMRPVGRL